MSEKFKAGDGSIWAQPYGPNTKPYYLGCHGMGDITRSRGDVTLTRCPDPAQSGKFKVSGSYIGEPSVPTTSIENVVASTADWLEKIDCPFNLFVHKTLCSRRDLFTNYDRSFVLRNAIITGDTYSNLLVREPADNAESMGNADLSFEELINVFELDSARQSIVADANLLAIAFCNSEVCAGSCGPAELICEDGWAVGVGTGGAVGMLYYTNDGGGTWTVAAADPFAVDEDISAVGCMMTSRSTTRVIVARGTTDAGNPAEVAYSDDGGATWTAVDLGSTNALYVLGAEGLFVLDQYNVWTVTDGGYIFYSADSGATWTEQEDGTLTAEDLYCVMAATDQVVFAAGVDNTILKTIDGGTTWSALTGPAGQTTDDIIAMHVIDKLNVWVGYDDGTLWYTHDGGVTWAQRAFPGTSGEIRYITFYEDLIGYVLFDNGVGSVPAADCDLYRTIDGGYTWQEIALPTNDGGHAMHLCDPNTVFIAGNVVAAGTAYVAKVQATE